MPGTTERKGDKQDDPYHVVKLPECEDPFAFANAVGMHLIWVYPMCSGEWELTLKEQGAIIK